MIFLGEFMNIAFHTLGCKVNQFETQALEILLSQKNHTVTDDLSTADVIVVNTCTVTSVSDQKSRRIIRHFAKTYPNAKIAVCGCLSQLNPESIREIPGVALVSGTSDKHTFADKIDALSSVNTESFTPDKPLSRRSFEQLPAGGLHGHTRAMLKIEDGCCNFCSYCIIPYSRGPVRSMPMADILAECKKISEQAYREVVITGIEISSYGRDLSPRASLEDAVAMLCSEFPSIRFRLGSIEPRTITETFCEKLKSFTNLCPHFHLSMQSGCDETLARMNRKYDTERFFESISLLRRYFENCAITTDMIVGFPGETEDEFSKTLDFIEKCAFSSMHIFPYSKRNGTPAAKMPDQITKAEKSSRAKRASEIAKALSENYLKEQLGRTLSVLFEEVCDGFWSGHAMNYSRIYVKSEENLKNKTLDVYVTSLFRDGLCGEIVS